MKEAEKPFCQQVRGIEENISSFNLSSLVPLSAPFLARELASFSVAQIVFRKGPRAGLDGSLASYFSHHIGRSPQRIKLFSLRVPFLLLSCNYHSVLGLAVRVNEAPAFLGA